MRALPAPATVWETLRHLRARQIRYQIARRLLSPARACQALPLRWRPQSLRVGRSGNSRRVHFDGGHRFVFNNEPRDFPAGWEDPAARKLWLYHLHAMGWLFDLETGRDTWIRRWMEGNPPDSGGTGWEPYPLSLRLFHWCKHFRLAGSTPDPAVLASIGGQAGWLLAHLEFHLDANHLLENLLALAYVGFSLDPAEPSAARAGARIGSLLERELESQFLPDGGHYELSPMYHAILLERLLDLLNAWPEGEDPFPGLREKVRARSLAGLDWLDAMSVGGRFSLFNDSAYDAAPDADLLLAYGTRLLRWRPRPVEALRSLNDSGYHRAEAGPFTLIFDGGPLGPDHQLGHAQGDMLSLCLWKAGQPILVHPGNYEYLPGPMRDYCRSTASHNTLAMEGYEQAGWWASHRVGRRGRTLEVTATVEPLTGTIRIRGSHDGFARLKGRPFHVREIALDSSSLTVYDRLTADPGRSAAAFFHFHPDCILEPENDKIGIRSPAGNLVMEADRPMRIEESWHCPEFGLRIRNLAVRVECGPEGCRTRLSGT